MARDFLNFKEYSELHQVPQASVLEILLSEHLAIDDEDDLYDFFWAYCMKDLEAPHQKWTDFGDGPAELAA